MAYGLRLRPAAALNAVFMIFSTAFWRASLNSSYFKLVTIWMAILLGVTILMGLTLVTFVLFPLFILILIWTVYFTSIVSSAAYNMSDEI